MNAVYDLSAELTGRTHCIISCSTSASSIDCTARHAMPCFCVLKRHHIVPRDLRGARRRPVLGSSRNAKAICFVHSVKMIWVKPCLGQTFAWSFTPHRSLAVVFDSDWSTAEQLDTVTTIIK